jgi:hypothetical protein
LGRATFNGLPSYPQLVIIAAYKAFLLLFKLLANLLNWLLDKVLKRLGIYLKFGFFWFIPLILSNSSISALNTCAKCVRNLVLPVS